MSIVKNFAYNSALTLSSYIVNFVIFSIISRTLGVDNVGIITYVDNIINYFVLFASLGISTVGIREIAATKDSEEDRSKVFFRLVTLMFILVVFSSVIYIVCILTLDSLQRYQSYFLIGLGKIVLMPLMIEWLFTGMQDFKFITIRTLIIKVLYLISVVSFVKNGDDSKLYFALTSLSVMINFAVNVTAAKKYVSFKYYSSNFQPYLKPIVKLGVFAIITSLYSTFNYVYLGTVAATAQVGFYYTAVRIYDVIMQLFRSYTIVAMPKMSELNSNRDIAQFEKLLSKSYYALFSFSIPLAVISIILSPLLVDIIAGPGYETSAIVMRIIMPILVISGINQINGVLVLMPMKKDNILLITASAAAVVGIISNVLLDSRFGAYGSAITILLSEFVGCCGGLYYTIKHKITKFPGFIFFKFAITSLPYFAIYAFVHYFVTSYLILYSTLISLFAVYFMIQQLVICKNELLIGLLKKLKQ